MVVIVAACLGKLGHVENLALPPLFSKPSPASLSGYLPKLPNGIKEDTNLEVSVNSTYMDMQGSQQRSCIG